MGKSPAFQLYASDFDMDTASWDNEEVGIYFRLLMYQWVNKSIPDDINRLARIARIGQKRFKKSWRIISNKFQKNSKGGLFNQRMELIRQEQDNYRKLQSESGKRGVEIKRKKGIYPFKKSSDPSSNPISDPATQNQALQSSSSSLKEKDDKPEKPPAPKINKFSNWIDQNKGIKIYLASFEKTTWPKIRQAIGEALKKNKHPVAIKDLIIYIYKNRNKIDMPHTYFWKTINIISGNYYANETETKHKETKTQEIPDLGKIFDKMLKDI